jgi:undecaprenyl-phosphate 4-deoxy-4-formamido-L-arabinose transferase
MVPFRQAITIVVPVYNSESILPVLVARIESALSDVVPLFELILVNDGSRDRSWEVICDLASRHKSIRGVNLMRNYGQHNALLCGIRLATHDVVVTIDDDLQHPPDQIPKLLERLGDDCDVVYGTPLQERHGLLRDVASRITKMALQSAMGADTARSVSAFRALRTNLRDAFSEYRGPFVSVDTLLTWGTVRFAAVTVESAPRYSGQSNYTFRKLIVHAFNMMTGFSTIPLQFASWIGFAFTVVGVAVLAYVLIRYLIQGAAVPGFAFLASIIALFSGAQLFALGILGEYLARMHFRIMDRPPYAVRAKTGVHPATKQAGFDGAFER